MRQGLAVSILGGRGGREWVEGGWKEVKIGPGVLLNPPPAKPDKLT